MRIIILWFLMLPIFLAATAQRSNILLKIQNSELQLYPAVEKNNIPVLEMLLHPNFSVRSSGSDIIFKNDLLTGFRNGKNPYQIFRQHSDTIVIVNHHLAISSGKEVYVHKTGADKDKEKLRNFIHVWTKYKGTWTLASRYVSN